MIRFNKMFNHLPAKQMFQERQEGKRGMVAEDFQPFSPKFTNMKYLLVLYTDRTFFLLKRNTHKLMSSRSSPRMARAVRLLLLL